MSVDEWAERFRVLPPTSAEPGRWRTDRTPYLAEPMQCLSSSSPVERVVIMAAAQVGKTEVGLNLMGSVIQLTPGLMLFVAPTTEAARRMVRTRVDPLLEATPELRERIVTPGPRKAGNSSFLKAYPGGSIAFVGANSGVGLRSTPARFIVLDEIDAYPFDAGGEGDPVQLAIARTATFRGRRKILMMSTPTLAGVSRIERAYSESDMRKLFWLCRSCGSRELFAWSSVHWPEGDPSRAHIACTSCGCVVEEREKPALLAEAEWRATAPGDGRTAGFHVPGTASPFVTWAELATDFLAAKKSAESLQVFVNTGLGEPFEDRETAPLSADTLAARGIECDPAWTEELPDQVVAITCGADIQADRIECEFVGWGRDERSFSIDYAVIHGDTALPDVWNAFDRLLLRRFRHARHVPDLPVIATAIDSGYKTDVVMRFSAERLGRRVWAVKGRAGAGVPPWPKRPPKARRERIAPVHVVGVDAMKATLLSRLRIEDGGPGSCCWPADRDHLWFGGIVAERPVRRYTRGVARIEWLRDTGVRNEPLDCRVYATAALHGAFAAGFRLSDAADRMAASPLRAAEATPSVGMKPRRPTTIRSSWLG